MVINIIPFKITTNIQLIKACFLDFEILPAIIEAIKLGRIDAIIATIIHPVLSLKTVTQDSIVLRTN